MTVVYGVTWVGGRLQIAVSDCMYMYVHVRVYTLQHINIIMYVNAATILGGFYLVGLCYTRHLFKEGMKCGIHSRKYNLHILYIRTCMYIRASFRGGRGGRGGKGGICSLYPLRRTSLPRISKFHCKVQLK